MVKTRRSLNQLVNIIGVPCLLLLGLTIGCLVVSGNLVTVALFMGVCVIPLILAKGLPFLLMVLPIAAVFWVPLFRVGTYNITALFLVVAGLAGVVMLMSMINHPSSLRRDWALVALAFLPLLFGMVGSTLTIGSFQNLINGVLVYTVRFALYSILPVAFAMAPRGLTGRVETVLVLSLLVSIGYSVLLLPTEQKSVANFGDRATGVFYNPNVMGDIAVLAMNWALGRVFDWRQKRSSRWLSVALAVVAMISMLRSGSRSALVAASVSVALWGAIMLLSRRARFCVQTRAGALIALCALGILGITMLPRTTMWIRLQEVFTMGASTPNVSGRIEALRIGWEVFTAHPLGIGVGNLPIVARPYSQSLWDIGGLTTTDNQFFEILIESGVPGLLAFIATLIILARRSRAAGTPQGYSVMVNIVAMSVAGLAAFTFYSPFISSLLWTMYGIVANDTHRVNVAQAKATRSAFIAEVSSR